MAQTSPEVASLLVPGMHGAKKCRRLHFFDACIFCPQKMQASKCRRRKTRPACRPCTVDPPICLTRSGSKCRAAQQPLILPANGHRPPPSQAREATCLACIALEASGLGNLGRQGQQRRKSGQGERTGTLFDCIWLGRAVKASRGLDPASRRHNQPHGSGMQILPPGSRVVALGGSCIWKEEL